MSALKRLSKELADVKSPESPTCTFFRNISVDESNLLHWEGLMVCEKEPYAGTGDTKGFRVELTFPPEYPFKPPKLCLKTQIYHPNIDEKGQVCLPIITAENWKPATKASQVLLSLKTLLEEPEVSGALRPDLADQLTKDPAGFRATALAHVDKHAELVKA